jgi:hypothetical protein
VSAHRFSFVVLVFLATFSVACRPSAPPGKYVRIITPLVNRANLATLKNPRAANERVQKIVHWLEMARRDGCDAGKVLDLALKAGGYHGEAAVVTKTALLHNLGIAAQLGCLGEAGMKDMMHGHSPTISSGDDAGQELVVDHIIPIVVVPALGNTLANLEFLPAKANQSKGDKLTDKARDLAKRLHAAGLLSEAGLNDVLRTARSR